MIKLKYTFGIISVFLFAIIAGRTNGQAVPNIGPEEDREIERWRVESKIPALGIGVIRNGTLQQIRIFGESKTGLTAGFDTIFNVASLTKPITAMVALKLVSQGKLGLDESLDKYWIDPDIKDDPRHSMLTARIILSHQSGFANWRRMNSSKKLEFAFTPGTRYQYSGEGFEYLKKALEAKFDTKLEDLARELIFQPLGMQDTRLVWDESNLGRYAVGYNKNGEPYEIVKRTKASAADDLLTTIADYGKFLSSVMNGAGLSDDVAAEMVRRQVKTKEDKYFGLGWEIYDLKNGDYALSHGGSDEGCQTIVFIFPKTKDGLIIFTNSDNGTAVYLKLIEHFLGDAGKRIVDTETKSK